MDVDSTTQRIARLTPLGAVLALIESRVGAVPPRKCTLALAHGGTLAEDVVVSQLPPFPIALRDGFAVEAAAIADAGPYMPVPLTLAARRIDVGQLVPSEVDAVLPQDAVALRGRTAEAVGTVTAGEGVLPAGGDAASGTVLRRAGERLRTVDVAVLAAAGIAEVTIRAPRIRIVGAGPTDKLMDSALAMLVRLVASAGGAVFDAAGETGRLDRFLTDDQADAVIAVGGTGTGRRDDAVQTLAQLGGVEAHGIAVSPGETAAFGFVGTRPVLLIPGRLDATLALWLLIGSHLTAKLAGGAVGDAPATLPLKRKVTSTIGLTEMIPVRCTGDMAEPLAVGYLSFAALTRSDGWIVIPADSEGFASGTTVAVNPWP
jgi:molybdopterin molybdotransferase